MPSREPSAGALAGERLSGVELLVLSRSDRAAARAQLAALPAAEQAACLLDLHHAARHEFLMLLERPEDVVPLLPEQELVATLVAGGPSEAAWLVELATPEQRIACIDLDGWKTWSLEPARLREWIDAFIEAGRPTLVRALGELDPELWVLGVADMADVLVLGKEDEPPPGWSTEDGVCYLRAKSDADAARVKEIAGAAFSESPAVYWQIVYGMVFELPAECEEFALRWRQARLSDLGFPDREQAMRAYRPLTVQDAPAWDAPRGAGAEDAGGDAAGDLVPSYALPEKLRGTALGRALAELPVDRAADVLGYVLAVANAIAVADGMSLSDPDSIPQATAKAIRGIDRGLSELARARGEAPAAVLDRTRPLDLFRIGATADPELGPVPLPEEELERLESDPHEAGDPDEELPDV